MAVAIPKDIEKLFDEEWSESIEATECHMMYSDYNPTIPEFQTAKEYFEYYYECQRANFNDKANKALAFAVELDPRNPDYLREYAKTGYTNKKFWYLNKPTIYDPREAVNLLIELENNNPQNYIIRANLYRSTKEEHKFAIEDIITAIKLGLNNTETYELLGDFYAEAEDIEMALKAYSYAIELTTKPSNLYLKKANLYFAFKKDTEAFYNVNQSLYYDKKNADAEYLKYKIYLKYGKTLDAKYALIHSLDESSFKNETWHRLSALAEMHHNDKEYKEEIKILNKLIAMHSTYYFKADYSWQKIKALFLSFRLLEIIPTYIFMIKMKFEDFKLGFTSIE